MGICDGMTIRLVVILRPIRMRLIEHLGKLHQVLITRILLKLILLQREMLIVMATHMDYILRILGRVITRQTP